MIELCRINHLKVVRDTPQGLYLEDECDSGPDDTMYKNSEKTSAEKEALSSGTGKKQEPAARFTGKKEDVLLPRPEVPKGIKTGDELDVFIYLDSSDRYTATLKTPLIFPGMMALLKVVQVTDIGIFLDWGLDKNLLLPFREVVTPLFYDPLEEEGYTVKTAAKNNNINGSGETDRRSWQGGGKKTDGKLGKKELEWLRSGVELPVILYIDKSGRPAATMRVYDSLSTGDKYAKESAVEFTVIQINPGMGVFVAVDDKYFGMINIKEITDMIATGDRLFGRISEIRDDGKYMVSLNLKAHIQMDNDAQVIWKKLNEAGGILPFGDKSDPKDIMREFGMSKKAFKRAVGQLYKEGKVVPGEKMLQIVA